MSFDIRNYIEAPPLGWKQITLSEIAEINANSLTTKNYPDWIKYIDISSVSTGSMEEPKKLFKKDAPSRAKRIVKDNDILISTVRPNLKQFLHIETAEENLVCSTGFCVISPKSSKYKWFIYSLITSELFTEYLTRIADGAAYPSFNPSEIRDAIIYLPDEPTLNLLEDLIGSLNLKIKNNSIIAKTLEEIIQTFYKSWFVDFDLVHAKKEGRTIRGISQEIMDLFPSNFGKFEGKILPKGWKFVPLSSFLEIDNLTVNPFKSPDTLWHHYSIPAYDVGMNPSLEQGTIIKSNKFKVTKDAVLVSKLNPRIYRAWYIYLPDENHSICSTEFIPYKPKTAEWKPFIYQVVTSEIFKKAFLSKVSGSTGSHQRVNPTDSLGIQVCLPDNIKIIEKSCEITKPIIERICCIRKEFITLSVIRDTLLPKI